MFNIQLLNNHGTRLVILGRTLGAIMISFSGVWVKLDQCLRGAFSHIFRNSGTVAPKTM